jgi:ubiquinone/menaquinone biosynthesis C-methylase UbiE
MSRPQGQDPGRAGIVTAWLADRLSLDPGGSLLEIAAGTGIVSFTAAATRRPSFIACSDIDLDALLVGATLYRKKESTDPAPGADDAPIMFVAADMHDLPFPDASFDAAVCRWAFMFSENPIHAFREARRVLRSGGRLTLAVWGPPNDNPWQAIIDNALMKFGVEDRSGQLQPGGMYGLANETALRRTVEEAGFTVEALEHLRFDRAYRGFSDYWSVEIDVGEERPGRLRAMPPDAAESFRREIEREVTPYRHDDGYRIPALNVGVVAVSA